MNEMNLRNCAYLGDALWETFVREWSIGETGNAKLLHKITTSKVNAEFQAKLEHEIENELTEPELEIARRARNLPIPIGRRSIQTEYRQATAFEALIGWWYLNDKERYEKILGNLKKYLTEKNQ